MTQPPEDFTDLRRMLAWKRHETPPPGYFDGFSAKVIARIEAAELAAPLPWWRAFLAPLNWQRGLAGANALICVGTGLVGVAAYQAVRSVPEDDNAVWAPLPLQAGIVPPSRSPAGLLDSAGTTGPVFSSDTGPVSLAGFTMGASSGGTNDHSAPPGLFSPPGIHQLRPRFVFSDR